MAQIKPNFIKMAVEISPEDLKGPKPIGCEISNDCNNCKEMCICNPKMKREE